MANVGTLAVNLVARTETFTAKMKGAGKTVGGLQGSLAALKPSVAGVAVAFAAAAAAAAAFAKSAVSDFATFGDEVHKTSLRTGLTAEELTALGHAAELSGSSMQTLANSVFRMNRRVANAATNAGPAARAIKLLKLNAEELSNLNTADRMFEIVAALNKMGSIRSQLGSDIFGTNQWKELEPLIASGVSGMKEAMATAVELNLTLSTSAAASAALLTDAQTEFNKSIRSLKLQLGEWLAPPATALAIAGTDAISAMREFGKEHGVTWALITKSMEKALPPGLRVALSYGNASQEADKLRKSMEALHAADVAAVKEKDSAAGERVAERVQELIASQQKAEKSFDLVGSRKIEDQLAMAKRSAKGRDALDAYLEKGRERRKSAQEEFLSRGASLAEAGRSPFQIMAADMQELNQQFLAGNISLDAMRRLAEDSARSFNNARKSASSIEKISASGVGVGAVSRGSVAGFSAVASAGRQTQIARMQLATQQSMDRTLQAIENNLPEQIDINEIEIN